MSRSRRAGSEGAGVGGGGGGGWYVDWEARPGLGSLTCTDLYINSQGNTNRHIHREREGEREREREREREKGLLPFCDGL
jgi:tRNA A37 threonylcarbamoyladenosine dehydratase